MLASGKFVNRNKMLSAKEIKAFLEIGQTMGLTGEELRKYVESEKAAALEIEKAKLAAATEAEKAKLAAEERAAAAAQQLELEKAKLTAEAEKAKLAAESEQRAAAHARELELEKLKIAAQEREYAREQKELDARREQEKAELDARLEREKLEHAERMRRMELEASAGDNDSRGSRSSNDVTRTRSDAIKSLKLPLFDEGKDDLDAYLNRFETSCEAYAIDPGNWALQLARLLQGKALDVYQRMSSGDKGSYEALKEQLLERFKLDESGYRKKFRESRMESGETPIQFIDRLCRYLTKWREMAELEASYEGLESLIVRDQYFHTCSKELQTFLKEQGNLSLREMAIKSKNFIAAHGQSSATWNSRKDREPQTKREDKSSVSSDNKQTPCEICKRTNHKTADHRDRNNSTSMSSLNKSSNLKCFLCGSFGHKKSECDQAKKGNVQRAAAMQVIPDNHNTSEITKGQEPNHKCGEKNDRGEVKLACGCSLPVVAGAWSDSGKLKLEKLKSLNPCSTGKINGITATVLRDTGCTCCVVKSSLVNQSQMTGQTELCVLIDGAAKRFATAMVDLDTPYFTGTTKALCMENPIQEIIIGNIPGALDPQEISKQTGKVEHQTNEQKNTNDNSQIVDKHNEQNKINKGESIVIGGAKATNNESTVETVSPSDSLDPTETDETVGAEQAAAVQTRSMVVNENKPKKPLKVPTISGLDISVDKMKEMQVNDESLKKSWAWSKQTLNKDTKFGFVEKNGLLYRAQRDTRDGGHKFQLVVPKELREKVMSLAHETLLSGHRNTNKTIARITSEFYFPHLYELVRNFCASCDVCQRTVSKGSVGKAPLGKLPLIGVPFSSVCVDIIGPLSPPSDGYRYILTIIDQCTRFPEAIPMKDIETHTVAECLLSVFARVGCPNVVHSDNGSQFTSGMMDEAYRLMSVDRRTTSSPYHPQGNGLVENFNRTIKNMLRRVTAERPKDWSRYLVPLMFAVRDTPQDSTGFSPFELLYGRTVRTPMTLLRELWSGEVEEAETKTTYEYVLDLRERIESTCALAMEELSKVQARNQKYYNRKARNRQLHVGESVLLLLPTQRNKLLLSWQGPYKVVSKVGDVDYRIEMPNGRAKTFHVNMLKKYNFRSALGTHNPGLIVNNSDISPVASDSQSTTLVAAAVACVLEDGEGDDLTVKDSDLLPLYNVQQKETIDDVKINPELSEAQKREVRALLEEYQEIFSDIPKVTHLAEHKVVLTQNEPVRCKGYPIPYQLEQVINKELDDMLAMGIIERSDAAYASPIVMVKKSDNTYRMCVNFKELNKITVFDPEPMMSADDIFPKLSGSKFYSTFDFCKGYWAIPMEEGSKDCTSFITPRGLMRFRTMPFGMVNAGSTYNRMVRKLLDGTKNLESYVDDIIGYTGDWTSHMTVLRDFCERVRKANLSLKPSKCKIGFDTVDFLGHTLKTDFIGPQSETVGRILNVPRPQTKRQCRSLLGLVNFYRRYIPNCATLIAPLTEITKKKSPHVVKWEEQHERSFTKLKEVLSSEPILKLPDIQKEFILQTDASNVGIGACLFQQHDGIKHPVMYASKKLLDRERNYSVGEREALAIVWAVSKFYRFLYGTHFILESDHRPLQYLNTSDSQNPRVMRWSLALQPFRYTVKYIRGDDNFCADYLSRCHADCD